MNFLRHLFQRKPQEYVLLRVGGGRDDNWLRKPAEEYCGEWYASPYLPENTRTRLLPGGKVEGQCYVREWRPATDGLLPLYREDEGNA